MLDVRDWEEKIEVSKVHHPASNVRHQASVLKRGLAFLRRRRIILASLVFLGPFLLKLLARSLKVVHQGREHLETCLSRGERVICVFWHGRLLMMPFAISGVPVAVLISQHRDGEQISRIVERFGFLVIRGSATRGGMAAVRRIMRIFRRGWHLAITPDGPRGPRGKVKAGVVELARLTGATLLPLAFGASRGVVLNSWDAFLIPLPFSKGVYVWGEPLHVRRGADEGELAKFRQILEERLQTVTSEADTYFTQKPSAISHQRSAAL